MFRGGLSRGASVWYIQPLLAPILGLSLLGTASPGACWQVVKVCMIVVWTYIQSTGYIAKLIPLYGGYAGGRSNFWPTLDWYRRAWRESFSRLGDVTLPPPVTVLALAGVVVLSGIWLGARLCALGIEEHSVALNVLNAHCAELQAHVEPVFTHALRSARHLERTRWPAVSGFVAALSRQPD